MQAIIMHLGFLAHGGGGGGRESVFNLRVICIAYRTAQIYFQSVKSLFKCYRFCTAYMHFASHVEKAKTYVSDSFTLNHSN